MDIGLMYHLSSRLPICHVRMPLTCLMRILKWVLFAIIHRHKLLSRVRCIVDPMPFNLFNYASCLALDSKDTMYVILMEIANSMHKDHGNGNPHIVHEHVVLTPSCMACWLDNLVVKRSGRGTSWFGVDLITICNWHVGVLYGHNI